MPKNYGKCMFYIFEFLKFSFVVVAIEKRILRRPSISKSKNLSLAVVREFQ